jgi:hypothetical protein
MESLNKPPTDPTELLIWENLPITNLVRYREVVWRLDLNWTWLAHEKSEARKKIALEEHNSLDAEMLAIVRKACVICTHLKLWESDH